MHCSHQRLAKNVGLRVQRYCSLLILSDTPQTNCSLLTANWNCVALSGISNDFSRIPKKCIFALTNYRVCPSVLRTPSQHTHRRFRLHRIASGCRNPARTPTACDTCRAVPSLPSPADLRPATLPASPLQLLTTHCQLLTRLSPSPPKNATPKPAYLILDQDIIPPI